jgi:hypothetical protein
MAVATFGLFFLTCCEHVRFRTEPKKYDNDEQPEG